MDDESVADGERLCRLLEQASKDQEAYTAAKSKLLRAMQKKVTKLTGLMKNETRILCSMVGETDLSLRAVMRLVESYLTGSVNCTLDYPDGSAEVTIFMVQVQTRQEELRIQTSDKVSTDNEEEEASAWEQGQQYLREAEQEKQALGANEPDQPQARQVKIAFFQRLAEAQQPCRGSFIVIGLHMAHPSKCRCLTQKIVAEFGSSCLGVFNLFAVSGESPEEGGLQQCSENANNLKLLTQTLKKFQAASSTVGSASTTEPGSD